MTSAGSALHVGRHRTERRFIPPFGDGSNPHSLSNLLERVLERCRFAPFPERKLTADTHILEAMDIDRHIEPRFEIVIDDGDMESLTAALGCNRDDLTLGLTARSRHLRRYEMLTEWRLDSLPSRPWSPAAEKMEVLQTGRDIDFVLAVRVSAQRRALRRNGLERGKVLTRREFAIKEPVDTVVFPFEWVEFGGSTQYPDELLWAIRWHDDVEDPESYSRPVSEVLTVLVNKKAEERLIAMNAASGAGDMAWRMLASEITVQIWADALKHTTEVPDDDEAETLLGQIFSRLSSVSGKSYAEVKGLAQQNDSLSDLRGLVARLYRVVG